MKIKKAMCLAPSTVALWVTHLFFLAKLIQLLVNQGPNENTITLHPMLNCKLDPNLDRYLDN